jgi:hypothetical protein
MAKRIVVVMSDSEAAKLNRAADRVKLQTPGKRVTRSDIVREGSLRYAAEVLGNEPEAPKPVLPPAAPAVE